MGTSFTKNLKTIFHSLLRLKAIEGAQSQFFGKENKAFREFGLTVSIRPENDFVSILVAESITESNLCLAHATQAGYNINSLLRCIARCRIENLVHLRHDVLSCHTVCAELVRTHHIARNFRFCRWSNIFFNGIVTCDYRSDRSPRYRYTLNSPGTSICKAAAVALSSGIIVHAATLSSSSSDGDAGLAAGGHV